MAGEKVRAWGTEQTTFYPVPLQEEWCEWTPHTPTFPPHLSCRPREALPPQEHISLSLNASIAKALAWLSDLSPLHSLPE